MHTGLVISAGLLQYINWDNVFIAGGSVLASLQPVPERYATSNQMKRQVCLACGAPPVPA